MRVAIVERGQCGREASWAGAGVLQCGSWHRKDTIVQMQRASLKMYPGFVSELVEHTGIDPEYLPCGSYEMLLEEQQYQMARSEVVAAEAFRSSYGGPVLEFLTPDDARQIEPKLTHDMLGVKVSHITCQIRNPLLLQALRIMCERERIKIIESCSVQRFVRSGERVAGVQTDAGTIEAGHVLLAAGSWSSLLDSELATTTPVYPVRGQIILLEKQPRPFTHIIEQGKCYMVPRLDGRIVIGATEEHDSGYDKRNTAEGVHHLLTLATRLVPPLAEATILRTWAGLRPGTPDNKPYIGPVPGMDGLVAATGHFRSGLILAPLTARIITDLIVRGQTDHDLTRFAPGRSETETELTTS